MLRIAGSFRRRCRDVAVLESGRLMTTAGWSRLKVVVTMTKIRRIARMSMSETMMTAGIRRLRV